MKMADDEEKGEGVKKMRPLKKSNITHAYFALPLHVEIVDTGDSLDVSGNTRSKYGVRYRTI